jgi:hypothetical protein
MSMVGTLCTVTLPRLQGPSPISSWRTFWDSNIHRKEQGMPARLESPLALLAARARGVVGAKRFLATVRATRTSGLPLGCV